MPKRKKTIVVTGGYGFIGSRFIRLVHERTNYNIINIDKMTYAGDVNRLPESIREDSTRYKFFSMDICDDFESLNTLDILELRKADYVVNFAAESHVDNSISDGKPFIRSNIEGVFNLIEFFRKGKKLKKFVQISTDEVYGDMADLKGHQAADETFPIKPSSYYSSTKSSADAIVQAAHRTYGLPYLITRSCNNFGPNQHKEKFLPKIAHSICNNLEVPLYGDGCQSREWIHVDDNADLILELTLSDTAKNGVYNIGSNLHYKNIEIIQILSGFLNKSVKYKHVADRLGHDKVYRLNCSKLFSFYGEFTPYPLEGFLKDEINKYEDSVNRR